MIIIVLGTILISHRPNHQEVLLALLLQHKWHPSSPRLQLVPGVIESPWFCSFTTLQGVWESLHTSPYICYTIDADHSQRTFLQHQVLTCMSPTQRDLPLIKIPFCFIYSPEPRTVLSKYWSFRIFLYYIV